jgi:hypothetical protein
MPLRFPKRAWLVLVRARRGDPARCRRDEIAALRRLQRSAAAEVIDERKQGRCGDHFAAGPRRFRSARFGTNEGGAHAVRGHGRRQCAGRGRESAIESDFAEADNAIERVERQRADSGHHRERNREIVVGAFFRQIGGREIDDEAPGGDREANGSECRAHAFARFGDGFIPKANDDDAVRAAGELDLYFHAARFEPGERDGGYICACLHGAHLYPQAGLQTVPEVSP